MCGCVKLSRLISTNNFAVSESFVEYCYFEKHTYIHPTHTFVYMIFVCYTTFVVVVWFAPLFVSGSVIVGTALLWCVLILTQTYTHTRALAHRIASFGGCCGFLRAGRVA